MSTLSPQVTPYYGGGQAVNPANVIQTSGAPPSAFTEDKIGTLAVDNAAGTIYGLASKSGGVNTWAVLGGGTGAVATLTGGSGGAVSPSGGNISILGTANQITSTGSGAGHSITFSLPAAITAPGSLTTTTSLVSTTTMTAGTGLTVTTGNAVVSAGNISATAGSVNAGTSMTATLGDITASNGNLSLATAGNKIIIATGANASVGTSGAMSGTPGVIAVATTASSATAKIFYSRATTGGTPGEVSITAQDGTGFTLTSTGNETSTFNWWIINA